jgi:hypothetical protein
MSTAQCDFASQDRDAGGLLEYVQKFVSDPGKEDMPYRPVKPGEDESPLRPLVAGVRTGGYGGKG